jgi:hypothetical protein
VPEHFDASVDGSMRRAFQRHGPGKQHKSSLAVALMIKVTKFSYREIAAEFGISAARVRQIAVRNGLERSRASASTV